jgi:hypothetical protein
MTAMPAPPNCSCNTEGCEVCDARAARGHIQSRRQHVIDDINTHRYRAYYQNGISESDLDCAIDAELSGRTTEAQRIAGITAYPKVKEIAAMIRQMELKAPLS